MIETQQVIEGKKETGGGGGKSQLQIRGWGAIPLPPFLIQHNIQSHSFTLIHLLFPVFPIIPLLFLFPPTSSLVAGRQFKWTFNPNQGALRELAGLPSPKWRGKWIH